MMRKLLFSIALILSLSAPVRAEQAAVNLSHSGAASQPRLVASPDGELAVFWWDRFDGLMSAFGSQVEGDQGRLELAWSDPVPAAIYSDNLSGTPFMIADGRGWVHAFWLEADPQAGATKQEAGSALMHSQMTFGKPVWSFPEVVAESAVAFDVSTSPAGRVGLAYVRTRHTQDAPAGVYVKRLLEEGWTTAAPVYTSIYFRLLQPDLVRIQLASYGSESATEGNRLAVLWEDINQERAYAASSTDGGQEWSEPQALGEERGLLADPRLATGGRQYLIWQFTQEGGCALYQQELLPDPVSASGEPLPGLALSLGMPQRILSGLSECPQDDRFWPQGEGMLWIWGEGTASLSLAAWDPLKGAWSTPQRLSFAFQDEASQRSVNLNDLHPVLVDETLAVVGVDEAGGEVWFSHAVTSALELAYAPPSPWGELQHVSTEGQAASSPALAMDGSGQTHLVWSQAADETSPGAALYYAQAAEGRLSRAVEISPAVRGEVARQPALLYDALRDVLHLVWSGGADGAILHSWVNAREASSPGAWLTPQTLSGEGSAAWPQIAQDAHGVLYVLYVVPLNEGRGVYLLRSQDGGETWTGPEMIFDAAAAKWGMVDHPALAVTPEGVLHAAWVQAVLPGMGTTRSLAYAFSKVGGAGDAMSWSQPLTLAGPGYDWPHLALARGQLHILYASTSNGAHSLYHRRVALDGGGSAWGSPASVPGWKDVALPYGLAASGAGGSQGDLFLVGAVPQAGLLRYTVWDGERWAQSETLDESALLKDGQAAAACVGTQGGALGVAWVAAPIGEGEENPALFISMRSVPEVEAVIPSPGADGSPEPGDATPEVTPTPTLEPTPVPTATPELNIAAPAPALPIPPLAGGGVLAGVFVVGMFALRWWRGKARA